MPNFEKNDTNAQLFNKNSFSSQILELKKRKIINSLINPQLAYKNTLCDTLAKISEYVQHPTTTSQPF